MRVLVLRPEPAAARTAERLAALGHETVRLPLSKAEHAVDAVKAALAQPHGAIAVTSAEMARLFERIGGAPAGDRNTIVFAVGEATAKAMRQSGFTNVLNAEGDGESLAGLIAAHVRAKGPLPHPLLYLAGNPRGPGFETRLAAAGIPFRTVEGYRMVPLAPTREAVEAALLHPVPDAVLLYSRESACAFFALAPLAEAPARFAALHLLCISANVAAAVPQGFPARVAIARAPSEESLFALL
ncbi:uroporphyrinogen-III synthase [Shinella zoogloeoides]|uniref:uroporphyrinogen-III synthase n=1 Tax=Shinella zoogloeoides TaxID=352475 RepID=UPI0028A9BC21|nr:uroporphyrinogen-III synthase [Shinella zoogloeoides]